MYSLNMPVSAIRTKMRQEFERHRYVAQVKTVDVLLFQSHQEYQVRKPCSSERWIEGEIEQECRTRLTTRPHLQETLNFWKQVTHVLKYFRAEEDPKAALPKTFIQGFLEVCHETQQTIYESELPTLTICLSRDATKSRKQQDQPRLRLPVPNLLLAWPVMIPLNPSNAKKIKIENAWNARACE